MSISIAEYFDKRSETWNDLHQVSVSIASRIIEAGHIQPNMSFLDIGCGTGAMFPVYLHAQAAQIVGLDMSQGMINQARRIWADEPRITVEVADICTFDTTDNFDRIVFYNVWPHIRDTHLAIENAMRYLKPNGVIVIAHGASKETINAHHVNVPKEITRDLLSAEIESQVFDSRFDIEARIDNEDFYAVVARLK